MVVDVGWRYGYAGCGRWDIMTKVIEPGDIGLTKDRQNELLIMFKSVVEWDLFTPAEFLRNVAYDPQFTLSERVFISFLVGGSVEGGSGHIPPSVWESVRISKKRDTALRKAFVDHFKGGNPYISTTAGLQYALSEPDLSDIERMFIGSIVGETDEPSVGFDGT
jgi:hypothetical protein